MGRLLAFPAARRPAAPPAPASTEARLAALEAAREDDHLKLRALECSLLALAAAPPAPRRRAPVASLDAARAAGRCPFGYAECTGTEDGWVAGFLPTEILIGLLEGHEEAGSEDSAEACEIRAELSRRGDDRGPKGAA